MANSKNNLRCLKEHWENATSNSNTLFLKRHQKVARFKAPNKDTEDVFSDVLNL